MANCKILILEDEPDIRETLQDILEGEGYEVSLAANGRDGLKILESSSAPDLILLDLMMPVMNGVEFFAKQKRDERFAKIPVVLMTADAQAQKKAEMMGVEQHMKKPVELEALLNLVKSHCAPKEAVLS